MVTNSFNESEKRQVELARRNVLLASANASRVERALYIATANFHYKQRQLRRRKDTHSVGKNKASGPRPRPLSKSQLGRPKAFEPAASFDTLTRYLNSSEARQAALAAENVDLAYANGGRVLQLYETIMQDAKYHLRKTISNKKRCDKGF